MFNFLNAFALLLLGAATLCASRLVYSRRGPLGGDLGFLIFRTAASVLFVLGLATGLVCVAAAMAVILPNFLAAVAPVAAIVIPALAILAGMVVASYRACERRSLLSVLGIAVERGIPLSEAARAFAAERHDLIGVQALRLAELLEQGTPMSQALSMSGVRLPADAELAAQLAPKSGSPGAMLREAVRLGARRTPMWRNWFEQVAYLSFLVLCATGVLVYYVVYLSPTMRSLLRGFDVVRQSRASEILLETSEATVLGVGIAIYLPVLIALFVGGLYYAGWVRTELPFFRPFTRRAHGANVLAALAAGIEQGRPLPSTLEDITSVYPQGHIRRRLVEATAEIHRGRHWCDALAVAGLVGDAESAVFKAAERGGNLAWAMREMAEGARRRLAWRLQLFAGVAFPLLLVAIALPIAAFVFSAFQPLIDVIEALA
jgi:general secretion pathway protein F